MFLGYGCIQLVVGKFREGCRAVGVSKSPQWGEDLSEDSWTHGSLSKFRRCNRLQPWVSHPGGFADCVTHGQPIWEASLVRQRTSWSHRRNVASQDVDSLWGLENLGNQVLYKQYQVRSICFFFCHVRNASDVFMLDKICNFRSWNQTQKWKSDVTGSYRRLYICISHASLAWKLIWWTPKTDTLTSQMSNIWAGHEKPKFPKPTGWPGSGTQNHRRTAENKKTSAPGS